MRTKTYRETPALPSRKPHPLDNHLLNGNGNNRHNTSPCPCPPLFTASGTPSPGPSQNLAEPLTRSDGTGGSNGEVTWAMAKTTLLHD